jgi:two-component system, OmpR family, KDP operon response regulator KdpE
MVSHTAKPLVLLIEDETPIRQFLRNSLTEAGYRLAEADSGKKGLLLAQQSPPDLVILDLGLPDIDGQDVLQQLRAWLQAPILIVSARDQEAQKVAALDHGADDYLTKPFNTAELLARIRVALRHAARTGTDSPVFEQGHLKVDLAARRVFVKGEEIHLTPIEYKLLTTLLQNAGKVLTHRFLLREVWGPQQVQDTHYLRVFMAGLRRKIEDDPAQPKYLLTDQGIGYRFATPAADEASQ